MEERGVVSLLQSKARSFVKGGVPESVFTRAPIGPGEAENTFPLDLYTPLF